ncbi:MAG: TIM barrel protein [Paracoccaceae bacterium]
MENLSVCIEMLFRKGSENFADRIALAKKAGFTTFEFWHWSNKDLVAIETAMQNSGLTVTGLLAEPKTSLANRGEHEEFIKGLRQSIKVAQRLKAPFLYIQSGDPVAGLDRETQIEVIVECLQNAAKILHGTGVTLLLEPVSDSPGCFLDHAGEGLDIIAQVDRPEVRLLLDVYHAAVLGEDVETAVGSRTDLIAHVHLADHPGRGAPGTGTLDLEGIKNWLREQGYTGLFGLEHKD